MLIAAKRQHAGDQIVPGGDRPKEPAIVPPFGVGRIKGIRQRARLAICGKLSGHHR